MERQKMQIVKIDDGTNLRVPQTMQELAHVVNEHARSAADMIKRMESIAEQNRLTIRNRHAVGLTDAGVRQLQSINIQLNLAVSALRFQGFKKEDVKA